MAIAGSQFLWRLAQKALTVCTLLATAVLCSQTAAPERIPGELLGKWKITKELNTRTISCWGEKEARAIIGTTIEYSPDALKWRNLPIKANAVKVRTITADEFSKENSSPSVSGSQIDFGQLGIKGRSAIQISIDHAEAQITGATVEFPGDEVLVKTPDVVVFSLCNVYFEAKRIAAK